MNLSRHALALERAIFTQRIPSAPGGLQPMPLGLAILFFGIPALIFRISVYWGLPFLLNRGVSWFGTYVICYDSVLLLMILAALAAYKLEGIPFSRKELRERFWLGSLTNKDWKWILGGFFAASVGYLALSFTERWIADIPLFSPPAAIAYLDLRVNSGFSYSSFMGIPLVGNWWMFLAIFSLLVLNIVGEEIWWRSYILPRQEVSAGKNAWVVNGLFWSFFHVVSYPWTVLSYLPICLTIPFVVQRLKKAQAGMVIHFVLNLFHLLIPITLGIMGIRL